MGVAGYVQVSHCSAVWEVSDTAVTLFARWKGGAMSWKLVAMVLCFVVVDIQAW